MEKLNMLSLYKNKTLYLLVPYYIGSLGSNIVKLVNKVYKVVTTLSTTELMNMGKFEIGDLAIGINKHYNKYYYNLLFDELKKLGIVKLITLYDDDIILLVINNKNNSELIRKYKLFLQGKYSQMYSREELAYYFRSECKTCQTGLSIINKDIVALKMYEKEVKNIYGIKNFRLTLEEYQQLEEGALPPTMLDEVIGSTSAKFVKDVAIKERNTLEM